MSGDRSREPLALKPLPPLFDALPGGFSNRVPSPAQRLSLLIGIAFLISRPSFLFRLRSLRSFLLLELFVHGLPGAFCRLLVEWVGLALAHGRAPHSRF